jgi:predicted acetyltransferase
MTSPRTTWPVRTLGDDDWRAFLDVDANAFGMTATPELEEAAREIQEPGRDIGAYDEDVLVGIAGTYSLELTVPGGTVPAAGVSWVGVLPTHRRRGVLGALMDFQLGSVHDAGREPIAVLWASEPQIYGRFGYGLASRHWSMTVPRSATALSPDTPADPELRLRLVPAGDWKATAGVYDEIRMQRPGMLGRDDRWWARAVLDLPDLRQGGSALRCVVAEDAHGVRGYARYSTKQNFDENFGSGRVNVREVLAVDPAALATLYRYLFDLDLMGTTSLWNVPVDDPLLHWLENPRRAKPEDGDALYVRLVDLPAALSARSYSSDVDVVLDVEDRRCPWNEGRWRLTGGTGGGTCTRTDDAADLTLGARDLGAAYLGGTSLRELAGAGRVTGTPDKLQATSHAFGSDLAPWCPVVF